MEFGLTGKTVIVTGGSSNIGRSISLAFGQEGCNVVVADIDQSQAEKVKKDIELFLTVPFSACLYMTSKAIFWMPIRQLWTFWAIQKRKWPQSI